MDDLILHLEKLAADSAAKAADLMAQDRIDDANLEKIRGNVYGIFVSVLQAAAKNANGEPAQRELFEKNLERIPANWHVARDAAEKRGDAIRLAQEDVKLNALADVKDAYARLWGDTR